MQPAKEERITQPGDIHDPDGNESSDRTAEAGV